MAVREIKTTIALDGEQKFKQAIAGATREMRVMESELKAISAAYDVNGDSASFYAQKQSNLRNQINQQAGIIKSLEQAVEDATKAYGAGSKEVDGYAIKLNNAHTKMSRLEKQLEETDREMEELGRDSVKVGRQIDDGIGDGAEAANADLRELYDTMSRDLGSIKASTAITAVKGLWDTASGAFSAVEGFAAGTREYRQQISFLKQSAEAEGFDFEFIKKQLLEVQTITGKTEEGLEGLAALLTTGMSADQLERANDLLLGATIKNPNRFQFNQLAVDMQQTLATQSATGSFAELLESLKVDVEEFNTALQKSPTAAGDANIALAALAQAGLGDVYNSYVKANGAIITANEADQNLRDQLSTFGETLEEYITTPVKKQVTDALRWVNEKIAEFEKTKEEEGVKEAVVKHITKPGVEAATANAVKEAERAEAQGEAIKAFFSEFSLGGVATGMANWLHRGFASTTEAQERALLAERAAAEPRGATYYDRTGLMSETGEAFLPIGNAKTAAERVEEIFGKVKKTTQEKTPELEAAWTKTGSEAMDAFAKATKPGMEDASNGAYDAGLKAASSYHSAIRSQVQNAYSAGAMLAAAARQGMQGGAYMPAGPINKNFIASLNIDGREFARVFAPYMDAELQVNTR